MAKFKYDDFKYDDFTYDPWVYSPYAESTKVKQYEYNLNNHNASKPGDYQSKYLGLADEVLNNYMNREKFSYDINGDALYQQYKDKFMTQGKMAMQDTTAQAAAMTGGYGNSYAATVGNQAYQASLQNLNDVVPQLYQMAYDRYTQEGQDMLNQYNLLTDRDSIDYGRYRDTVSDWNAEREYLTALYNNERNFDYSVYSDNRDFDYGVYSDDRTLAFNTWDSNRTLAYNTWDSNRSLAYDAYRDEIADDQWQKEYNLSERSVKASERSATAAEKSAKAAEKAKQYAISSYSSVPDNLRKKIDTMLTSGYKMQGNMPIQVWQKQNAASINKSVGNYLDGMVATGEMSPQVAAALMREYYIEE